MFDITKLIADARPVNGVSYFINDAYLLADAQLKDPVVIFGKAVNINTFTSLAKRLAFDSIVVLEGVKELPASLEAKIKELKFIDWKPASVPEGARAWVKSAHDGIEKATHLEYVLAAIEKTGVLPGPGGAILELGCGDNATPHLHAAIEKMNRVLVTIDSNEEWLTRYSKTIDLDRHLLEATKEPSKATALKREWAVALVDIAGGPERVDALRALAEKCDYILVHDTEDLTLKLEDALKTFKYRRDFRQSRPWTTVVSMKRPWDEGDAVQCDPKKTMPAPAVVTPMRSAPGRPNGPIGKRF